VKIKQNSQDDVTILELSGKVMGGPDHEKFHGEVKALLEQGQRKFLLDLSGVGWVNSTGIGILVSAYHSITREQGQLKLCCMNDRVLSVYYVTQLDKIFETHESREEALAAFAQP
jgi:anti-sigma B factor antagonist